MLASPGTFQAMIIQRNFRNPKETNGFHIRGITPEPVIKLLGVLLDNKSSFNHRDQQHVSISQHI